MRLSKSYIQICISETEMLLAGDRTAIDVELVVIFSKEKKERERKEKKELYNGF
jgi:hypothetical protein